MYLIQIDFSDNYCGKYASEIQSVHFIRGSFQQMSLHSGVLYLKDEVSTECVTTCAGSLIMAKHENQMLLTLISHLKDMLTPDLWSSQQVRPAELDVTWAYSSASDRMVQR